MALGLADQALSSATNFALVVLGARRLGPSGLGVVAVGFLAVTLVVVYQRSLIVDPLVVTSAARSAPERAQAARAAFTLVLLVGVAGGSALFALGALVPGTMGRGLLLFAPWLPSVVLQDYWRFLFFRDGRGEKAVLSDFGWGVAMLLAAIAFASSRTDVALVAIWGTGAATGAFVGIIQARILPLTPAGALGWWKRGAWGVGRGFAVDRLASSVGGYGVVLLVAMLLGSRAVGGWRAVDSVFAPMTFILPALSLAGLLAFITALD
jgi:hypothetical protein